MELKKIGLVKQSEDGFSIVLNKEYREALVGIEGYQNLHIIWYANNLPDNPYNGYVIDKPYVKGPDKIGVFATRSQIRPNPICMSIITVLKIDVENGIIYTPYIDTFPDTPVIDIKPYLPATDIVKNVSTPKWCSHWPKCLEESAYFDWEAEFNF